MRFAIQTAVVIGIGLCGCAPSPAVEAESIAERAKMARESIGKHATSSAQGDVLTAPSLVGLLFAVEPKIVAPGSTVTLMLRNETPYQIGYNLCASGLEQSLDGSWRTVPHESVCTLELRTVPPGQVARYQRTLPGNIAEGEYRFRTSVETPENPATPGLGWIFSEPFIVGR